MWKPYLVMTLLFANSCAMPQKQGSSSPARPYPPLTQSDIRAIIHLVHGASREPIRGDFAHDYSRDDTVEVRTACPTCIWGDMILLKRISGEWRIIGKSSWIE